MPQHNILAPKTAKARRETGPLCIAFALPAMQDVGVASHPGPSTSRHLGGLGGGLLCTLWVGTETVATAPSRDWPCYATTRTTDVAGAEDPCQGFSLAEARQE